MTIGPLGPKRESAPSGNQEGPNESWSPYHEGPLRAKRAHLGPRGTTRDHVEPILKESAPLHCQTAVILEDFVQLSYQPAVIVEDFAQFPYQPAVITEEFAPFPYQPTLKPHKKQHKFRQGGRRVQKRPRSMNLCKTPVKVQVARTLCTRVRATSVFLKRFSKKRLFVETVCEI